MWLSGLRLNESLTLSWDDNTDFYVDLTGKHPRFRIWAEGQKSKEDEYLPMTPDFAQSLLETPEDARTGLVFKPLGKRGAVPTSDSVGRVVSAIGRKANVVVDAAKDKCATAHDLRRSFGTRWSKHVKCATLQKLMRHEDIKTTMDYYVDQDAEDVADDLWREFGANEESKMSAPPTVTSR